MYERLTTVGGSGTVHCRMKEQTAWFRGNLCHAARRISRFSPAFLARLGGWVSPPFALALESAGCPPSLLLVVFDFAIAQSGYCGFGS